MYQLGSNSTKKLLSPRRPSVVAPGWMGWIRWENGRNGRCARKQVEPSNVNTDRHNGLSAEVCITVRIISCVIFMLSLCTCAGQRFVFLYCMYIQGPAGGLVLPSTYYFRHQHQHQHHINAERRDYPAMPVHARAPETLPVIGQTFLAAVDKYEVWTVRSRSTRYVLVKQAERFPSLVSKLPAD